MNGTGLFDDVMSAIGKFLCKVHGVRDDHNYSPMLHTLFDTQKQQHESICDQEVTNLLWTLLEELKDISDSSNVFPKKIKYWMDENRPTRSIGLQTNLNVEMNDSQYVQITCDNNEINRRIDAFIKRKRAESDAFNRREFCQVATKPNASCARTNAVFVPRQSQKSLLKIECVENYVPDKEEASISMENMKAWPPTHPSATLPFNNLSNDVKERINNLNSVLIPNKSITENADIYTHLQNLEARVLFLESLSPEYFQDQMKNILEKNDSMPTHGDMIEQIPIQESNDEKDALLDIRIKELQEKLENKAKELRNSKP